MLDLKLSREPLERSPHVVVMSLAGQAEFGNGLRTDQYFNQMLQEEKPQHVLLDLQDLTFADSAFFSSLLFWRGCLAQNGGCLVLYGLRPEIAGTLRIMALDRVLTIRPDRATAVAALGCHSI